MALSLLRLPYGLKDGELIHISHASRGLSCDCVCPECGQRLLAKKGGSREHHFAHDGNANCASAVETALHLAAKKILEQRLEIVLPAVTVQFKGVPKPPITIAPEKRYTIDSVVLEKRIDKIVPDVLAYIQGRPLVVEVRVSHKVDSNKLDRIRNIELSAIEIDLSRAPRSFALTDIEPLVIEAGQHKIWLHNVVAEKKRRDILSTGKILDIVSRGFALHVDHCPIRSRVWRGKSYANVVDDCLSCCHALNIESDSVICGGF